MVPSCVLLAAVLSSYAVAAGAFYVIAARPDKLEDNVTGLRAAVAGFDARISTIEKRV